MSHNSPEIFTEQAT